MYTTRHHRPDIKPGKGYVFLAFGDSVTVDPPLSLVPPLCKECGQPLSLLKKEATEFFRQCLYMTGKACISNRQKGILWEEYRKCLLQSEVIDIDQYNTWANPYLRDSEIEALTGTVLLCYTIERNFDGHPYFHSRFPNLELASAHVERRIQYEPKNVSLRIWEGMPGAPLRAVGIAVQGMGLEP